MACQPGPVMSVPDVFRDPQVQHREMVVEVPHGEHGDVRMLGFPVKVKPDSCEIRRPAPELGEHSDAVLRTLGYSDDRIAELHARGVLAGNAETDSGA